MLSWQRLGSPAFLSSSCYRSVHRILCWAIAFVVAAVFTTCSCLASERASKPRIALALGGGGARGAAHIGVLKVLTKEGITPDLVFGSSTGALVGAWYCAGVSTDMMEKWVLDGTVNRAFKPMPIWLKVFLNLLHSAVFFWQDKPYPGIFSGNRIASLVNRTISPQYRNMEKLPIRFSAIATNLVDGQAYQIADGDLGRAVQASSAWPPLYSPVVMGPAIYADGGILANLPSAWAHDSGADIVVVVDVDEQIESIRPRILHSMTGLASRISTIFASVMDRSQIRSGDIVIKPDVNGILLLADDTSSLRRAMTAGEKAATEALPEIRKRLHPVE